MQKRFKIIACIECNRVYGAILTSSIDDENSCNPTSYYCFECAYSFVMTNEILGTNFCQNVAQFKKDCSVGLMSNQIQSNSHIKWHQVRLWMHRVRIWYENENK